MTILKENEVSDLYLNAIKNENSEKAIVEKRGNS